jgi:hypothetical protein
MTTIVPIAILPSLGKRYSGMKEGVAFLNLVATLVTHCWCVAPRTLNTHTTHTTHTTRLVGLERRLCGYVSVGTGYRVVHPLGAGNVGKRSLPRLPRQRQRRPFACAAHHVGQGYTHVARALRFLSRACGAVVLRNLSSLRATSYFLRTQNRPMFCSRT